MCGLHTVQKDGSETSVDNQAATAISNNPMFQGKTKRFKVKFCFLREVKQKSDRAWEKRRKEARNLERKN